MVAGKYLTYQEAGAELGLSADRVQHLASEGKLHSVKSREIGRKGATKYISDKELEAYKQRKSTRSTVGYSEQYIPATGNAGSQSASQSQPVLTATDLLQQAHRNFSEFFQQAINPVVTTAVAGIQDYRTIITAIINSPVLQLPPDQKAEIIQEISTRTDKAVIEAGQYGFTPEAVANAAANAIGASKSVRDKMGELFEDIHRETMRQPVDADPQPAGLL